MFKTIVDRLPRDKDYPPRQFMLDVLARVRDGTLYDHLEYGFHDEKTGADEYIPLRDRRPCVRYGLCNIVVNDSVSLLFSDDHFPKVDCEDEEQRDMLEAIIKESSLNLLMIEAAMTGSIGSVVIMLRVLKNRLFFNIFDTQFLTPTWKVDAPDTLQSVTERYKVKGQALSDQGYTIADDELKADFWFQRIFDEMSETWYLPWKVKDKKPSITIDAARSTQHNLGFVPLIWIKNLPSRDPIDGTCTFPTEAINTQIEIEYQLSQAGRGLKYSSDPTLLVKEPAMANDGTIIKGAGNALVVTEKGDAKLLEINGDASNAVIEYVKCLREFALECAHGNRANADKVSAAQSGRAMELMNQSLIWLAGKLRISYGDGALLSLLKMIVKASAKFPLQVQGKPIDPFKQDLEISLRWPKWYAATYADKQTEAVSLGVLRDKQLLSQETAVKTLAAEYDIQNPADEIKQIQKEADAAMAAAASADPNPKSVPLSAADDT